jgi:hypothetical protein
MTELKDESLVKKLGIESLPDEQKDRVLSQSADLIERRLQLRVVKSLSEEKRDQFMKLLGEGNPADVQEFILKEIPAYLDWVEEETNALKSELAGLGEPE